MSEPEIYVEKGGAGRRLRRFLAYRSFWIVAAALFLADRLTKVWIASALPLNPLHEHSPDVHWEVIPRFLYVIHIGNTGAAWSMFSGQPIALALLAVATLVGIFFWRKSLGLAAPQVQLAFGLAVGGIAGNLIDRLFIGHVIDFIDLHFGSYVYPTFNVADSGICVGVILYLWFTWRQPDDAK
ncbi:signal peptidase II [Nibricoccus sp. IMCC34717]|uniref:signal peptidase II n=1 Tax=Nibricoccus sp. IMCC34717 TaxID=3034021 RepID=UPI00384CC7BA